MGTAYYYNSYSSEYNDDLTIDRGLSTVWFNPWNDPVGAEVEEVRFRFNLDNNGGSKVDLGDVDIWMVSPDGERNRIYYNYDGFGADGDDGNDSDAADDYDIYFSGTDLKSSIKFGLDGNPVNGNWGLRIDNGTGITLDLNYLEVWVDYNSAPDLRVRDIDILGNRETGALVLIETWIENTGDQRYGSKVDLEYLVNDQVIGTSELTFGLNGGSVNYETDAHVFNRVGQNKVEVRIVNSDDSNTSNNSRIEYFNFAMDDRPDLTITDVRVLGGWERGETIEIRPFIENIGTEAWNLLEGGIDVEYFVDGVKVGDDSLSLGLTTLAGDWESFRYTLTKDGPHTIEVKVGGGDREITTANNSWSEDFGHDHDSGPQKTIANSAFDVKLGTFLAHTVYGIERIPEEFASSTGENGQKDDYRGYLQQFGWSVLDDNNGLGPYFRAEDRVIGGDEAFFEPDGLFVGDSEDINVFNSFAAQGLVALGTDPDGKKTLALTFRGTDDKDLSAAAFGQAFTGNGIYTYYEAMRPLIEAAIAYANQQANGIEKMVVSGHSLGGAAADLFTLVDAHRLDTSVDLTVVSLASAGLHSKALVEGFRKKGMDGQYDESLVDVSADGETVTLKAPSYYIGVSFSNDTVTFDQENPTSALSFEEWNDTGLPLRPVSLTPNAPLNANRHFDDGLTAVDLPNVSPTDPTLEGFKLLGGFGAEHDVGLYWAMLSGLADDPLVEFLTHHKVIMGETDYDAVADPDGDPFAVFNSFAAVKSAGYDNDTDATRLQGTFGDDYILGLSGDDTMFGYLGADLMSGGTGNDTADGGFGDDRIDGGAGADVLSGGIGDDIIFGGRQNDRIFGDENDDALYGDGGRDSLRGGDGEDRLYGGRGGDDLDGGSQKDRLFGGAGRDVLEGGDGRDILRGDGGRDQMSGNAGVDLFVFRKTGDSGVDARLADVILDFRAGSDKIHLRAIDASVDTAGNSAFAFIGEAGFTEGQSGEIGFAKVEGAGAKGDYTMVYLNVDADVDAEMAIRLVGHHDLTSGDFIL